MRAHGRWHPGLIDGGRRFAAPAVRTFSDGALPDFSVRLFLEKTSVEKLIYLLDRNRPGSDNAELLAAIRAQLVPVIKAAGGCRITVNIADLDAQVLAASPARIAGAWDRFGAALHFWLDSIDTRAPIEAAIAAVCPRYSGYLVTESMPQAFAMDWAQGERRPGVTQFTANGKPDNVSDEEFYYNWQVKHSTISFDLHPLRWSYVRNAVARPLTSGAPPFRSLVLEHFRELRDFTDESRYFGDPKVVQEMYADLPGFCEVSSMITGPMSEYHFD